MSSDDGESPDSGPNGGSSGEMSDREQPAGSPSDESPDGKSGGGEPAAADATDGPETLAEALNVRHNAVVGLVVGTAIGALLYLQALAGLGWAFSDTALYYLSLAFVAAASIAFVVTGLLCAKTGLAPVLERANWLRRGGSAAVVGGVAWIALPVVAALVETGALSGTVQRQVTALAALALVVGAAGLHAGVRDATGSGERVAYAVVLGGLLLATGNAGGDPGPIVETEVGTIATPFLLAAFVAFVATVPFAAYADLTGRLAPRGTRGLLAGSLLAVLAVGWLVVGGGWELLVDSVAAPEAVALAAVTVPAGTGWLLAGLALREYALALGGDRESDADAAPAAAGEPDASGP